MDRAPGRDGRKLGISLMRGHHGGLQARGMSRFTLCPTHIVLPSVLLVVVPLLVAADVARGAPPAAGTLRQLAAPNDCISEGGGICGTPTGRALNGPATVAVSPDGKNAYVASVTSDAVAVFSRDASNGRLTQLAGAAGCVVNEPSIDIAGCENTGRALNFAQGLTISPDGKFVYVTSATSRAIAIFARSADTGALTQLAGADGCVIDEPAADVTGCDNTGRNLANPASGMLAAGGAHFYVAGFNGIAAFARNANTGKLSQLPGADGCIVNAPAIDVPTCDNTGRAMEGTFALTQNLSGGHVYAGAGQSSAVAVFSRDGTTG